MHPDREKVEKAYDRLLKEINERQAFEKNNPIPPYSTYLTDWNYFDVEGYTLLHYAAALGDIEKINECLSRGPDINAFTAGNNDPPIAWALKNGHTKIAQVLLNAGADCSNIHPEICRNPETRLWLESKMMDKQFFTDMTSMFEKLYRGAEKGDIEFIKQNMSEVKNSQQKEQLLLAAARNGKQEIVAYLLSQGANVNPIKRYAKNALNEAALYGHVLVVDMLLKNRADATRQDQNKCTLMMRAVMSGSFEMVERVLEEKIDINAVDRFGNNLLHYCALCKSSDIIDIIMNLPGIKEIANQKNIYDETPQEIAEQNKNNDYIQKFKSITESFELSKSSETGVKKIKINQGSLIRVWQYYLNHEYRDKTFLSWKGVCNGLAYLHEYYSSKNMDEYFFDTLELMCMWDGSDDGLVKPFDDIEQKKFYANLGQVFEQWISNIIYLQHSEIENLSLHTYQMSRNQHMKMLDISGENQHVDIFRSHSNNATEKSILQIQEIMGYLMRMPAGVRFEIAGGMHQTSGHKLSETSFSFYDPNHLYKTTNLKSIDALVTRILDHQFVIDGGAANDGQRYQFVVSVFLFSGELNQIGFDDYHVFSREEMPKSKKEAREFQSSSPNALTHLHVAVMTHSLLDVDALLRDDFCDLEETDSNGRTAFTSALLNGFTSAADLIGKAVRRLEVSMKLIEFAESRLPFQVMRLAHEDVDFYKAYDINGLKKTCLQAIISFAPQSLFLMLAKIKDINAKDELGNTPLYIAVEAGNYDIVEELICRGADPNIKCVDNLSIVDLLESHVFSDQSFRSRVYELILPSLKFDNDSHIGVLKTLLSGFVLRNEIEFTKKVLCYCDQATLDTQDDKGYNVLHHAVFIRSAQMVKILLETDININAQTNAGNTAMMMILIMGSSRMQKKLSQEDVHKLITEFLLKSPDLTLSNNKGETVASLVKELYPNDPQLSMMLDCHMRNHPEQEKPKLEGPK